MKFAAIVILAIFTFATTTATAEITLVTGLEQCPEGRKIGTGTEILQWVQQNQIFIDANGGVTTTQIAELKRGGDTARYTLFLVNPASVTPTPAIKEGQKAIVRLSRIDPAWTGGGGTATTTPPGNAQTPQSVLNPFAQTLPSAQQTEFQAQLNEKRLTLEYQAMIWEFLNKRGTVVYNKELLSLLRPASTQRLEDLEEREAWLQFQLNQKNAALISAMNSANEMANKLIDAIRENGTQEFEQLIALVDTLNHQGYLLGNQMRLLEAIAKNSGVKVEEVGRDFIGGDQYRGPVYNNYYNFGGGGGSGSHFVGSQECYWESVEYDY